MATGSGTARVYDAPGKQISPALLAEMHRLNAWTETTQGGDGNPQIVLITATAKGMVLVPDITWRAVDRDPAPVLEELAREVAQVRAQMGLHDPVLAVILVSEVWAFHIGTGEEEQHPEYQEATRNRLIHAHPDGREARYIAAMDAWGRHASLTWFRDGHELLIEHGWMDREIHQRLSGVCPAFNKAMTLPALAPGPGDSLCDVTAGQARLDGEGGA